MSPERLQSLMGCVDAFVLPSEAEGFPLSLQEALANGLPVVTTRQPGYEHYLAPDDVLFVDRDAGSIRDALTRLAADEDLRTRLSARSRAAADRHFGVERVRRGPTRSFMRRFRARRPPVAEAGGRRCATPNVAARQNEGQGRKASACPTIEGCWRFTQLTGPCSRRRLAVRPPQSRSPSRPARSGSGAGSALVRPFASCGRSAS